MAKLFRAKTTRAALPKQLDVVIEGISHEGRGIARWKNKPLFVRGAWIGEKLSVKVTREQSRFAEADVIAVLEGHPERITPSCAIANVCGGCQLQHVPEQAQIYYKQQWVADQLVRFGAEAPKQWLEPLVASPWHYRHRARLSVWRDRHGQILLGFREQGTKTIVPVSECPILVPELDSLLPSLKNMVQGGGKSTPIEHVELLWDGNRRAVVIRTSHHWQASDQKDLENRVQSWGKTEPTDLWLRTQQGVKRVFSSDTSSIHQEALYHYRLDDWDVDVHFHPDDFTQVNFALNQAMIAQALQLLQGKATAEALKRWRVLDLFCGVGNFTLPLARVCGSVIGIEALPHMVTRGQHNARINGIKNAEFLAADLTQIDALKTSGICLPVDAVLLDPPRAGAKEILPTVVRLGVPRVIYVSCNSASWARDAAYLQAQGYRLETAGVMDMFPQTAQVETLSLFVK